MPWLEGTYVKGATNRVQVMSRTPATRRVAIVWHAIRASSLTFESPGWSALGTFEVRRVSPTTKRALNRNVPCANENDIARRVDGPDERKSRV